MVLNSFDTTVNFWNVNPQFKIEFEELYNKDKSKGKEKSSKVMWAIALLLLPDSIYKNMDEVDKKVLIKENYIKDKDFNWKEFEKEIELFENISLSKVRRKLRNWENKMQERDELIKTLSYTIENFDLLDKLIGNSPKLWKQYLEIFNEIEKEDDAVQLKGGAEESLSEQKRI